MAELDFDSWAARECDCGPGLNTLALNLRWPPALYRPKPT